MAALNYAKEYSNVLAQAYPYTLNFGDLYATPNNNGRYRWTGSKTIEIPTISTTCLLYTSDAADEEDSVDLGGRRIIKKKKKTKDRGRPND
ncbi:hypothetical protein CDFC105_53663 [Clostridioides difficile]|nr:hypothetical protein [Clostridioides difficile]CZR82738.1 hypothetical protein CDFC105_53663 [Clostridioides difficile]